MQTPLLIINFKNYLESSGDNAFKLAKVSEKVAKEIGVNIILAPPLPYLSSFVQTVTIPIFAQHIDFIKPGNTTGYIVPEVVKACGCKGTLLNHSEKRIAFTTIKEMIPNLKKIGLTTIICVKNPEEVKQISYLSPDFIAIEPPELIGSGRAVSQVKPEVISESIKFMEECNKSTKLICGAGISSGEDVKIALELGAIGVLVASSIVKSTSWEKKIRELTQYFYKKF